MKCWCVLVAAGKGERAGLGKNKVFHVIDGRSVLSRCLDALSKAECYDGIVLVLSRRDIGLYRELADRESESPLIRRIAFGGDTRQASVYNGLKQIPDDTDIVSIHDAARPFVTADVILATIKGAEKHGSGVISTPVTDTIKQIDGEGRVATLPRDSLRAVQTPQTFCFHELLRAHESALRDGFTATDDAMLYERYHGTVHLVTSPHAANNVKLTSKEDFMPFQIPLFRIGCGYDAHRLMPGRSLILCGVRIPYDKGLSGHSDADVAVHALMDALLGALGAGDIGRHFPDSDAAYKDISSLILLERVMLQVDSAGYRVNNADITVVAQRPRLSPYISQMRDTMVISLKTDCVNVKATTTERMGFEGEELGISAHAVVLLVKKNR